MDHHCFAGWPVRLALRFLGDLRALQDLLAFRARDGAERIEMERQFAANDRFVEPAANRKRARLRNKRSHDSLFLGLRVPA
jgi:hypothetical protein